MKKNNSIFTDNKSFFEVTKDAFIFAICATFYICFISAILLIFKNIIL